MRKIIFILLAFSFTACSIFTDQSEIINDKDLIEVLADIHLTDAVLIEKGYRVSRDSLIISEYYNETFKEHNITRKQFDETLKYYVQHPKYYDKLYDKVLEELLKRQNELNETENNKSKDAKKQPN